MGRLLVITAKPHMPMSDNVPNFTKLIDAVMAASTSRDSFLHGESHWKCVAWTGLDLCRSGVGADPLIVFLFGLLHDTQRWNDGTDPDHGRRAGAFARKLQGVHFRLSEPKLQTLVRACELHADGLTSPNEETMGTCWDADRLNLRRVGIEPDAQFLSTKLAKDPARIMQAERMTGQHLSWAAIYASIDMSISDGLPIPPRPPARED